MYSEAGKKAAEERSAKITTASAALEKAKADREAKEKVGYSSKCYQQSKFTLPRSMAGRSVSACCCCS